MSRTILHLDLDAFFCTVEEVRDPSLIGKPFAVGGRPESRGVIASASYPARARGVRSAMPSATALRLCPELVIVPPRFSDYRATSHKVMALLRTWTSELEQISVDEAFLDVTDLVSTRHTPLGGDDGVIARQFLALQLQDQVQHELGLACSIGVASNKLVAKIANDHGKATAGKGHSPRAICVVADGDEAAFLAPLPAAALWGVGPKMEARLEELGIRTIGDLAAWDQHDLIERFGRNGYDLSQHARGIDKRPVVTFRESKSISSETTFAQDVQEWEVLKETLDEQAAHVAAQLRKHNLKGSTVKVKLRWTDFNITTRQTTLPRPTDNYDQIRQVATILLRQVWADEHPVRLLGVGVSNLNPLLQLRLWDEDLNPIDS